MSGLPLWIEVVVAAFAVLSGGAAFISSLSAAASRRAAETAQSTAIDALKRSAEAAEERNGAAERSERIQFAEKVSLVADEWADRLDRGTTSEPAQWFATQDTLHKAALLCPAPNAAQMASEVIRVLVTEDAKIRSFLGALPKLPTIPLAAADLARYRTRAIIQGWIKNPNKLNAAVEASSRLVVGSPDMYP